VYLETPLQCFTASYFRGSIVLWFRKWQGFGRHRVTARCGAAADEVVAQKPQQLAKISACDAGASPHMDEMLTQEHMISEHPVP